MGLVKDWTGKDKDKDQGPNLQGPGQGLDLQGQGQGLDSQGQGLKLGP